MNKIKYKHIKSGGIYIFICEALKEDNQEIRCLSIRRDKHCLDKTKS